MNIFTVKRILIPALMILFFSGSLLAKDKIPAKYIKPDIDLAAYKKVQIRPLNLDDMLVLKPAWEQDNTEQWQLKIKEISTIQKLFMDAMQKELSASGSYKLVTTSAADVLLIEVEILTITPYVKPGTKNEDGGQTIETLGSGDLVFSAEFRDSKTRELLILVEGERTIGDKYKKLSRENHMKNVAGLFEKWGRKIRETLDNDRN